MSLTVTFDNVVLIQGGEISTIGLTINYVSYWTSYQAISGYGQGATKSGEPLKISHDEQVGVVEDSYIRFQKIFVLRREQRER